MRWAYAVVRVPRTLTAMMFATMLTTVLVRLTPWECATVYALRMPMVMAFATMLTTALARLTLWGFATVHALQMPMVMAFAIHRLLRAPLISSRFRLDRRIMRCI
jgi:hypothetical protein